jgi:hypothetical protein
MLLDAQALEQLGRSVLLARELGYDLVLALPVLALAQLLQVGLVGPVRDAERADLVSYVRWVMDWGGFERKEE